MINKYLKVILIILLIIFSFFYFFGSNIFRYSLTEKKDLTIEQIEKFEEDIKNGIEIDLTDYIVKDKTYDNRLTKINNSISSVINFGFKKVFEYIFKSIEV